MMRSPSLLGPRSYAPYRPSGHLRGRGALAPAGAHPFRSDRFAGSSSPGSVSAAQGLFLLPGPDRLAGAACPRLFQLRLGAFEVGERPGKARRDEGRVTHAPNLRASFRPIIRQNERFLPC